MKIIIKVINIVIKVMNIIIRVDFKILMIEFLKLFGLISYLLVLQIINI
jgi:hypothetical protein